ncbi:hypothetical protein [Kitasatospora atroaurantiaca]|uniref:L,D-transpeptidase-like protein n=1 Tax=Kitasatospora atroaurantiaca TaxID=285545 RepID=A0A561EQA7_9ACTN|nr:hypothetical protein [Kitasatospora atroaurantiaca]TWE17792.1 hypothetical protein FB465_2830 [Kitasatospora atroaurantiaca]
MPKTRPGVVVTALTVGAMAGVALLAYQANGAETRSPAAKPATSTAAPTPTASASPTAAALPANSGTGLRVVYSLGSHQVWLVDPKKTPQVLASFKVTPGSVEPTAGTYTVYSRTATGSGTDGKLIEHVVRFTQQNGTVFGFSAALDGSTAPPDPKLRTGGIRSGRTDGQSLWDFAPNGTKVYVIA